MLSSLLIVVVGLVGLASVSGVSDVAIAAVATDCKNACKKEKRKCLRDFKGFFNSAKVYCRDASHRKACGREARKAFKVGKKKCRKAYRKVCKPCCAANPRFHDCGLCPVGYAGNVPSGCEEIDECAINNGGCHALLECENTPGSFRCGPCPVGYEGTGEGGCVLAVDLRAANIFFGTALSCDVHLDWEDALEVGTPRLAHYNVYRDGELIGRPAYSLFEDLSTDVGPHEYHVSAVFQGGRETGLSSGVEVSTDGCDPELQEDPYLVRNVNIYPLEGRCTKTQVFCDDPHDTTGITGYVYFIDGQRRWVRLKSPLRGWDGFGGTDLLLPGTHTYSFAPVYDELGDEVGPLVEFDVTLPPCDELSHLGELKVAALLARLPEASREPFSAEHVRGIMLDYEYSVRAYLERVSYGEQTISAQVLDWQVLPYSREHYCTSTTEIGTETLGFFPLCDTSATWRDAVSGAVANSGFVPEDFDHFIIVIDGVSNGAYAGGALVWVSSRTLSTTALVHGLGHAFGLVHAGWWKCGDSPAYVAPDLAQPREDGCHLYVYGGAYDVMAVNLWRFNAHHKLLAGYLSEADFTTARSSGQYTLQALETSTPNGILGLRLPLSRGVFYMLEYRMLRDFDDNVQLPEYVNGGADRSPAMRQGVVIWYVDTRHGYGDTFAIGDSYRQVVIAPGVEFYDPYRRVRIRWEGRLGEEHAEITIQYD